MNMYYGRYGAFIFLFLFLFIYLLKLVIRLFIYWLIGEEKDIAELLEFIYYIIMMLNCVNLIIFIVILC